MLFRYLDSLIHDKPNMKADVSKIVEKDVLGKCAQKFLVFCVIWSLRIIIHFEEDGWWKAESNCCLCTRVVVCCTTVIYSLFIDKDLGVNYVLTIAVYRDLRVNYVLTIALYWDFRVNYVLTIAVYRDLTVNYVLTITVHRDFGVDTCMMYSPLLNTKTLRLMLLIVYTHHYYPQRPWGWCWCRWFLFLLWSNGSLQEDDCCQPHMLGWLSHPSVCNPGPLASTSLHLWEDLWGIVINVSMHNDVINLSTYHHCISLSHSFMFVILVYELYIIYTWTVKACNLLPSMNVLSQGIQLKRTWTAFLTLKVPVTAIDALRHFETG